MANGVVQTFEQKMSDKLSKDASVQPFWQTLIPILLEVLIPLLGNCFGQARGDKQKVLQAIRNPGLLQRAMLRRAMSNSRDLQQLIPGMWERERVKNAMIEVGEEATDEELMAMIDLVEENNVYFL